ncbi:hypothetical protein SEA_APHELION_131 [Gordonia phage Aphelion]|uniref:Uncharacterized protein n=1 Tax=Gordonia phage Aphelion TaxID=2507860 RepID=A0A410TD93_9CAUD|nr:hypothetical protein SEA_APHELION_131 [Gordonia phage Aphelion]
MSDTYDYTDFATGGLVVFPEPAEFEYRALFFDDFASENDQHTENLLRAIERSSNAGKWIKVPEGHPADIIEQEDEDEGLKVFVVLGDELTRVRSYFDEAGDQWLREYNED